MKKAFLRKTAAILAVLTTLGTTAFAEVRIKDSGITYDAEKQELTVQYTGSSNVAEAATILVYDVTGLMGTPEFAGQISTPILAVDQKEDFESFKELLPKSVKPGDKLAIKVGAKNEDVPAVATFTIPKDGKEEEGAKIEIPNITANAGDVIDIPVTLGENTGFTNLSLEIGYDTNVLTFVGVKNEPTVGGSFIPNTNVNPLVMTWTSTTDMNYSGTIATVTFKVNESAGKTETHVTVDYYKGPNGSNKDGVNVNFDKDGKPVKFTYVSGKVRVVDYKLGDINNDGRVNNKDATTLLRYLAGLNPAVNSDALDVNGDGSIDSKDAVRLLRYLAGWDVVLH